MRPVLLIATLGVLVAALITTSAWSRPAGKKAGQTVVYEGRLEDGKRQPIGGVFALSFSLHKRPKGGKSLWSESHFVAIDHGGYVLELGSSRPIPAHLDLENLFLSVSLTGGAEIIRERLAPSATAPTPEVVADTKTSPPPSATSGSTTSSRSGKSGSVVDYAETSGLAYEAEHAKTADKLGSLTEEERYERLKSGGGKTKIGSNKRITAMAGGDGGVPFEVKCPKGHVVTGVRGGEGIYLDSIQLICSPLE